MKISKRFKPTAQTARVAAIVALSISLVSYKLGSLTNGLAASEETRGLGFSNGFEVLKNDPTEAPGHVLRNLVEAIAPNTLGFVRLSSVLLGLALLVVSYLLIKKWYGQRLATFGIVLLASAPWFLHVSRLATNDILYPLGMASVMLLAAYWHQKEWRPRLLYGSAITVALLSYVPGMVLLVLVIAAFERKYIYNNVLASKKHAGAAFALGIALVAPLIIALARSPELGKRLLGFDIEWPSLKGFSQAFIELWQNLFIGGLNDPIRNLGELPVSNALVTLSFVVGVCLYVKHRKATRSKQLLGLWLVGTALVALQGPVSYTVVLPIVIVLAVGGIGYLLHLWLKTFPKNPYARVFGIGLIGLVVVFAMLYNIRNYYVAWPNAPEVRSSFTVQLL